jgi:hypothetical protein
MAEESTSFEPPNNNDEHPLNKFIQELADHKELDPHTRTSEQQGSLGARTDTLTTILKINEDQDPLTQFHQKDSVQLEVARSTLLTTIKGLEPSTLKETDTAKLNRAKIEAYREMINIIDSRLAHLQPNQE